MFRDTLLESAPVGRKRKRWPMALAFTFELLVGAALIALPLLSTGILVFARPTILTPRLAREMPVDDPHPKGDPGTLGVGHSPTRTIDFTAGQSKIPFGKPVPDSGGEQSELNLNPGGSGSGLPNCDPCITPVVPKPPVRVRISVMQPGSLIHRVDPFYPKMAGMIGVHGEVRLHAIIAKDGAIQSLTAISGHPFLAQAAMDAVKQWRYQPYILNGEAVEVETFITVNFNRGN